jgi:hypothetical protein
VQVRLLIPGGGTLSEAVTVNIAAAGTAQSGADYTLGVTSVTFAAGSGHLSTRDLPLTIVNDEVLETSETIELVASLAGDGIGGQVVLGQVSRHVASIVDDPLSASIEGMVWVDSNNNGLLDPREMPLAGVTVNIAGRDRRGQVVEGLTITDAQGLYRFHGLPAGTYDVVQSQPLAFTDGKESTSRLQGAFDGRMENDRFASVVVLPGQQVAGLDFGERGVRARFVTARSFLASAPPAAQVLLETVAWVSSKPAIRLPPRSSAPARRSKLSVLVRRPS